MISFGALLILTASSPRTADYTHTRLVKLGVDADLHVWEGLFHFFFLNPDVPESRDAYDVMVRSTSTWGSESQAAICPSPSRRLRGFNGQPSLAPLG
jgi:hypothetical protein